MTAAKNECNLSRSHRVFVGNQAEMLPPNGAVAEIREGKRNCRRQTGEGV